MRRFPRYSALAWKPLLILPMITIVAVTALAGETGNRAQILATGPLTVYGFVYDLAGQPLEGASIVVTIVETSSTAYATTAANGAYQAEPDIPQTGYDVGNTIRVVATLDSHQQQNSTLVTQAMVDDGLARVDVHYTYEIPEFGGVLGVVFVFVVVAAVAVAVLGKKAVR